MIALATLPSLLALLTSAAVQKAIDTYDYGDYAGACRQLEAARADPATPADDQPALLRVLGACHHVQGETQAAADA